MLCEVACTPAQSGCAGAPSAGPEVSVPPHGPQPSGLSGPGSVRFMPTTLSLGIVPSLPKSSSLIIQKVSHFPLSVHLRNRIQRRANMTLKATKFTPEVMLSAPRRSPGVPNPSGTLALYTVSLFP